MARNYLGTREAIAIACEAILLRASQKLDYNKAEERFALNSALRDLIWKYTEETPLGSGKRGCAFWTERALERFEDETTLRLEHVYPREHAFRDLLNANSIDDIHHVLSELETCVVLKEEHDELEGRKFRPDPKKPGGWWQRYKLDKGPIRILQGPRFGEATGEAADYLMARWEMLQSLHK